MAGKVNPVVWFEIPVADMPRAAAFYEGVFGYKLTAHDMGPRQMAMFDMQPSFPGIGGALVKEATFVPAYTGTLVYFSVADIPGTLAKVTAGRGKVLVPATDIGEYGAVAYFEDSEGNRVGLHTM